MKVIKALGDNRYEIEMEPKEYKGIRECGFGVEHDFAWFEGKIWAKNPDGSTNFHVYMHDDIHIPIKAFVEVALPMIIAHKYTQPEHLVDRAQHEDDKYFERYGKTSPRWKKGDPYPAYSYEDVAIMYYDSNNKQKMVAVCLSGEKMFNHMTLEFYNKYVKNKTE